MGNMRQVITDRYALYLDDCLEVMPQLRDGSVHFSIYSPPFAGVNQIKDTVLILQGVLG